MLLDKGCIVLTCLRKAVYSVCLMRPDLIMMVWKHWRSMAHSLQSVAALMVAVLQGQSATG